MLEQVERTIEEYHMLDPGDRVVVGVSGGADSVCLLMLLQELREKKALSLYVVHINHMLRKEADEEERYVKSLCSKLFIPCSCFRKDIAGYAKELGCSVEEAGRQYRYECFEQVSREKDCKKIAVAHHRNDRAETLLFHLIRGTGMKGLGGISPIRGKVIRPLLGVSRREIEAYLEEKQIHYYIDASNKTEDYSRNRIRNRIIPQLEQLNNQAVLHMAETADLATEYWNYAEEQAERLEKELVRPVENGWEVNGEGLAAQPQLIRRHLIYRLLQNGSGEAKDLERQHVEQVLELLEKPAGKQVMLPYGITAHRTYRGIRIQKHTQGKEGKRLEPVLVSPEGVTVIPGFGCLEAHVSTWDSGREISKKVYTKMLDYGKINDTFFIRYPLPGDYFIMNEQGERKKVSRFFIDNKIPQEKRRSTLVLASGSRVYWIIGMRIGEDVKINAYTKQVMTVEFHCEKGESNG